MGIVVIVIPTKSVAKLFFPAGIYLFRVNNNVVDISGLVQVFWSSTLQRFHTKTLKKEKPAWLFLRFLLVKWKKKKKKKKNPIYWILISMLGTRSMYN